MRLRESIINARARILYVFGFSHEASDSAVVSAQRYFSQDRHQFVLIAEQHGRTLSHLM